MLVTLALAACGGAGTTVVDTSQDPNALGWSWNLPRHFPVPREPEGNAMSAAKAELGRFLFYDKRLSGNSTMACASCHVQSKAFTDGLSTSPGSTGEFTSRNSPTLANAAYHTTFTWANPTLVSLEGQMLTPLFGDRPVEMGVNDGNQAEVLARVTAAPAYAAMFDAAFGLAPADVTWNKVIQAISVFQRTLISGNSLYDRYLRGAATLDEAQTRGMNLFFGEKAECFHCHGSFNFNEQVVHAGSATFLMPFRNTGQYNLDGRGAYPAGNRGLYEFTFAPADMGRFRAPTLRNVEVTGPYMHDGSVPTLEAVLDIYAAGGRLTPEGPRAGDGRLNPYKDPLISGIRLTEQDKSDLVAFLKALTDTEFLHDPKFSDPFTPR